MIHKVELTTELGNGMTIAHHFETVVDTGEEAREFGVDAGKMANYFALGFGEYEWEGMDE